MNGKNSLREMAKKQMNRLEKHHLKRTLHLNERMMNGDIIRAKKTLISFCCNDYLGLSYHPKLKDAAIKATQKYGTGAGASRLVTGNHPLYAEVETLIAEMKGTEAAAVFGSGYLANIGIITSLVKKDDVIFLDALAHSCMHMGAKASGAAIRYFPHNDAKTLANLLKKERGNFKHALIATETVFSMDGDIAPLKPLHKLSKEHDAWLLTDDAHSLGILAQNHSADIYIGTLSKAVGAYGGYVAGDTEIIEYIKTTAATMVYTTGLPPSVVASAIKGLTIIKEQPELRKKALANAEMFARLAGLPKPQSAIIPLILGDSEKALKASAFLEGEGFLVSAIRPPTVRVGTARLRFTFSSEHKPKDIERLAKLVKTIKKQQHESIS